MHPFEVSSKCNIEILDYDIEDSEKVHKSSFYAKVVRIGILAFLGIHLAQSLVGDARAADPPATDLQRLLRVDGRKVRMADFQGRLVSDEMLNDRVAVVSFVSVGCSIFCVARAVDLDRLASSLPVALRDRIVFLVIDTDPTVDDARHLRAFANELFGTSTRLRILSADADSTTAIAQDLHYPAALLPEPPRTVLLFDRRGRIAMRYGGNPLDSDRLARDLAVLDTFAQGLGHPVSETALSR